jgi:hypothetical protein
MEKIHVIILGIVYSVSSRENKFTFLLLLDEYRIRETHKSRIELVSNERDYESKKREIFRSAFDVSILNRYFQACGWKRVSDIFLNWAAFDGNHTSVF